MLRSEIIKMTEDINMTGLKINDHCTKDDLLAAALILNVRYMFTPDIDDMDDIEDIVFFVSEYNTNQNKATYVGFPGVGPFVASDNENKCNTAFEAALTEFRGLFENADERNILKRYFDAIVPDTRYIKDWYSAVDINQDKNEEKMENLLYSYYEMMYEFVGVTRKKYVHDNWVNRDDLVILKRQPARVSIDDTELPVVIFELPSKIYTNCTYAICINERHYRWKYRSYSDGPVYFSDIDKAWDYVLKFAERVYMKDEN